MAQKPGFLKNTGFSRVSQYLTNLRNAISADIWDTLPALTGFTTGTLGGCLLPGAEISKLFLHRTH